MLSSEEKERYHRHIQLKDFGEKGQERLKAAKVLIVGVGGLGSPVALYLAAAGVGQIGLVDEDRVSCSNLQRQVLYTTSDIGEEKVKLAKAKLEELNPTIKVEVYAHFLSSQNATEIIQDYDIIVDCTDGFEAKYLINDTCVELKKPFIHGSVLESQGQIITYLPNCKSYRDVFPSPPEGKRKSAELNGVYNFLVSITGSIQAGEVVKYLTKTGPLLTNTLLLIDGLNMETTKLKIN